MDGYERWETLEEKKKPWMIRNMPEHVVREIKVQAAREGRSVKDVLIDAIREYLKRADA